MAKAKTTRRTRKQSPDCAALAVLELQAIHSAETQLLRVLPRLAKAVESEQLRRRIELRQEQGERLIKGIETALEEMEESPGRKKNVAAEGLINDARVHVQEIEAGPALDAVLIGALQKTEHYCIAAWGTARSLAQAVEQKTAVRAMDRALKEGGAFDEDLTKLAQKEVMPALLDQANEEQDEEDARNRSPRNAGSERRAST